MSTSQAITEAALQLFYRQGFHASGVEQLSQEAGVTKKTLYRHFPSKEHLVAAALAQRHQDFMAAMSSFVESVEASQRPLAYLDFIGAWVQQGDFCGCLFINAAAEYSALEAPPHGQAQAHKQQLLEYLSRLCAEAGFTQPRQTAMQLFVLGEGLIVSAQVQGPLPELLRASRQVAELLTAQAPVRR
ncbi:TetR/AcrR family transcriptional regulator [Pseudomonas sp. 5P_3.1_Bac2]|uniref:TetR/AcrR family transcriptional regulator n=1 Tax=Pseudomonas sp. 5P_3.1_Bac2 TaxID=2971617 RepID=UPI0021C66313|nr:TetR/AcrR family transcriptional regulator [Pseudomonas sp. 5P_3.1_Bac2]MCU1715543.1 TetR/AcrR family transcriptional regulator [Pseudomonas sp. 5P_3.1_Bac2]